MTEEEKIILLKTNLELSIKLEQCNKVIKDWQERYQKYRYHIERDVLKRTKEDLLKEIDNLNEKIEKALLYIEDRYDYEQNVLTYTFDRDNIKELYEILKGGSNE